MGPFKPDAPESENAWVKNFIDRFAGEIPETSEAVISMPSTSQFGRTVFAIKGRAQSAKCGALKSSNSPSCSGIADAPAFSSRGRTITATILAVAPGRPHRRLVTPKQKLRASGGVGA